MGIDVSHWQGVVDWSAVRTAGHSFAFAKATDGEQGNDSEFVRNITEIRRANMLRGAYHFFHVNANPITQAQSFLSATSEYQVDMPLCLDLEDQAGLAQVGADRMRQNVGEFVNHVETAHNGRKMIIYGSSYYLSLLNGDYSGHPLWLAQYTTDTKPHTLPKGWSDWTFWQYSQSGLVKGVAGRCDLNHFAGDEAALRAWCKAN